MQTLKSVGRNFDHSKTKFLQKYGSVEKTVDAEFEEQRELIETLHRDLVAVFKDIQRSDEGIRSMSAPMLELSEALNLFYEEESETIGCGALFRGSALAFDVAVRQYLEKQKELYFNLEDYTGRLLALKKKIRARDDLCLEYDKYKTKFIKLNANIVKADPIKMQTVDKKYHEKKELYTTLNADLIAELKKVHGSRLDDFKREHQLVTQLPQLLLCPQLWLGQSGHSLPRRKLVAWDPVVPLRCSKRYSRHGGI
eukprot:TRINITY_DN18627_c0_g1_i1.p1 TRINITY_DN18627_c0_g1~~TRINITY_DN18627_c0_g1_i1.p1  ORF type:complete len:254 (+),score=77.06 TRINITY_DN18627_c0_g1_i1:111-872(+)